MARQSSMFVAAFIVAGICGFVQANLGGGEAYSALKLNGGTFIEVDTRASQLATKEFSFEAWIKVSEVQTSDDALRPIISRYNSSKANPSDNENDFYFGLTSRGKVVFFAGSVEGDAAGIPGFLMTSDVALVANTWYHVSFAIKYADINNMFPSQAAMYVDHYTPAGLQRETKTALWYGPGLTREALLSEHFRIGKYVSTGDGSSPVTASYFKGTIDEVRIWQGRRSAADINNFAFRTVSDHPNDLWALTPAMGGYSANILVLSYNFNQLTTDTIVDSSINDFSGTVVVDNSTSPNSPPDYVANDNTPLTSMIYPIGSIPHPVQLFGIDSNNIDGVGLQFRIHFDATLSGRLFRKHPTNGAGVNPWPVVLQETTTKYFVPGIGAPIADGDITTDQIVFIHDPSASKDGRFWYEATDGTVFSPKVKVNILTSCLGANDEIDLCGICNGANDNFDECGVCYGSESTCAGCDGIANSGLELDRCGVCDGNNTCVGCDDIPDSGLEYDRCGVCNGTNDCVGCDDVVDSGKVEDACGICDGNNTCVGCDGIPNSGKKFDKCNICGGNNSCVGCDGIPNSGAVLDLCLQCGGDNTSCLGCDNVLNSGIIEDVCGVCGGNGSLCEGCDGSGGGVKDACGLCRGDGSTCNGCDDKGSVEDDCGVCGGDNSTCTCVIYHGYHIAELDYLLLQWGLTNSIADIDKALALLDGSLEALTSYRGDLDLASVVIYLQDFLSNTAQYELTVDGFKRELDISLGNIYVKA